MLLQKVGPVLAKLPEADFDLRPYRRRALSRRRQSNWELSAERANATRRLLVEAGLQESRIRSVTGNADRDPLLPADPLAAANRRIAIVVLRTQRRSPEHRPCSRSADWSFCWLCVFGSYRGVGRQHRGAGWRRCRSRC